MLMVEISMNPIDKGESVGPYVARVLDIIDRSGLRYQLGPMGTCLEGDWDQISQVIGDCLRDLSLDSARVTFSVKGDWRKGSESRLGSKVDKVEKLVGRPLRKS